MDISFVDIIPSLLTGFAGWIAAWFKFKNEQDQTIGKQIQEHIDRLEKNISTLEVKIDQLEANNFALFNENLDLRKKISELEIEVMKGIN